MTPVDQARRRFSPTLRHTGVLLAVVATLSLAACSSSSSSGSSSSGTASSGSSSSSSSGLSSADQAGLAKAEALVASQTQRPTTSLLRRALILLPRVLSSHLPEPFRKLSVS